MQLSVQADSVFTQGRASAREKASRIKSKDAPAHYRVAHVADLWLFKSSGWTAVKRGRFSAHYRNHNFLWIILAFHRRIKLAPGEAEELIRLPRSGRS